MLNQERYLWNYFTLHTSIKKITMNYKNGLLITLFSFGLLISEAQTPSKKDKNEKEIKPAIDHVTVYLNSAQVSRTIQVTLPEGSSTLVIPRVSSKIDVKSIKGTLGNSAKVVGIDYGTQTLTSGVRDSIRIQKIDDTLKIIDIEKRRLISNLKSYQEELAMIEKNNTLGQGENGMSVADLIKLSDLYRSRVYELNQKIYSTNETSYKLNDLITKYNVSRNKLQGALKYDTYHEIRIHVQADAPTTTSFNIKYLVGGAAWTPSYDIRVEEVSNFVYIDYYGRLMNQTGEDWEKVGITLSTSDPTVSQSLPSLPPWTLSYNNQTSNEGRLDNFGPKQVTRDQAVSQNFGLTVLDNVQFEEIDLPDVAIVFEIKEKYSVYSDSRPYTVEITKYKVDATFQYFAIPKVEHDAFLLAQIVGWEKLNLIEGPTNIYFRGTFIGNSYIKPGYANDTLDISMGRDNKVLINRIKVEDKDSKKMLGTEKKEKFTYRISVRNTNSSAIELDMLDQIPVSQNEEIKVGDLSYNGAELDELSGQLKYRIKLEPGQAKEFTISFSVTYPKNKPIRVTQNSNISNRKVRAKY